MNAASIHDDLTLERVLANPDTRREWLKFQLALHGSSFSAIGRATGYTSQAVGQVAGHHYSNRKIEALIAKTLGMTPAQVWPERYREDYQTTPEPTRG